MFQPISETSKFLENQIETIFHSAVPYRVSNIKFDYTILLRECNDEFDEKAPKILAAKDGITILTSSPADIESLSLGDRIIVQKYRSENGPLSSKTQIKVEKGYVHARNNQTYVFDFDGIATLAYHDASLIRCYDFSYISRMDGSSQKFWITDRKKFDHKEVSRYIVDVDVPIESLILGARLRCEYIKFPKGSFHHSAENSSSAIRILPNVIRFCNFFGTGRLPVNKKNPQEDVLVAVEIAEKLESVNDLRNDVICLYTCLFCMFTKDRLQKIEKVRLNWKFSDTSEYAQVIYKCEKAISEESNVEGAGTSKNYINSLFTRYSTAILKHHDYDKNGRILDDSDITKEIHVKINQSLFKDRKIIIGFKVKFNDVLKKWKLVRQRDLMCGVYTLEPTDIFSHWRLFIDKLVEEEDLLDKILRTVSPRATMLKAFVPNVEPKNVQITFPFTVDQKLEEAKRDFCLEFGQLPYAHAFAREEILRKKSLVIIDGAAQTGKTTLNTFIVSDILERNLKDTTKCLALVSPFSKNLKIQFNLIKKVAKYRRFEKDIRLLNLCNFDDLQPGSFMAVIKKTLKEYAPSEEDREKLKVGMELLKTKFCGFLHESENGYDRDLITPTLTKAEKLTIENSDETYVDLITSEELSIFQGAITAIFKYYRPNFVIATNETFISFLPSMSNHITQVLVDEAGRIPFVEILNIIVEITNLEQLILNGDTTQYPYFHRIRLESLPICFNNFSKILQTTHEISYIQLNKIFHLHPGIVEVIKDNFYPERTLIPLFPPESLKFETTLCRDLNIPICFHNVDEIDEYVPPTTRKNYFQNFIAMKIIQQILSNSNFVNEKILILCNYAAEKELIQEKLVRESFLDQRRIKVKCVDNSFGENSDIVIYITTRAINEEKQEYVEYCCRLKEGSYQLRELRETFHYIFERQRIQTAISRAKKAIFIIGSRDLLRFCGEWEGLIQMSDCNYFIHPNLKEQLFPSQNTQLE